MPERQSPRADRIGSKERAVAWFARLRAEDCTPGERQEFAAWLQADELNRREFHAIENLWDDLGEIEHRPAISLDERRSWRRAPRRWQWAGAAAAFGLLFAIVFLSVGGEAYRTGDEQRTVRLADGSTVQLNAGTSLDTIADSDSRRTLLRDGEAFFSVEHGESPFIVLAGGGEIRDLGTKFLVRKRQDLVEVAVFEGAVAVTPGKGAVPVTLSEGGAYSFDSEGRLDPAIINTITFDSKQIVLRETPLHELVFYLNAALGQTLRLEPSVAFERISGIFGVDNLASVLETLPKILPVTVVDDSTGKWIKRKS